MAIISNVTQAVPFFGVTDMDASLRFYVDGLGFTLSQSWSPGGRMRWCWLDLGGAAIMLQEYTGVGAGAPPQGALAPGMSVCFMCGDAIAAYRAATSRGLAAERPYVGNGLWVTGLVDPDGYRLYFESPTDADEETIYQDAP